MRKRIQFTLLSLLMAASVLGQRYHRGYVITLQGDTLRGFLQDAPYQALSRWVQFKSDRKSEARRYFPADLREFGFFDGDCFRSFPVEFRLRRPGGGWRTHTEQRFLYLLEEGSLSLYELRDEAVQPLFLWSAEEGLRVLGFDERGRPAWREQLRSAVADCPHLRVPPDLPLTLQAVRALIRDYHRCDAPASVARSLPRFMAWLEVGAPVVALSNGIRGWAKGLHFEWRPTDKGPLRGWSLGIGFEHYVGEKYELDIPPTYYGYRFLGKHSQGILRLNHYLLPGEAFQPYLFGGMRYLSGSEQTEYMNLRGQNYPDEYRIMEGFKAHYGAGVLLLLDQTFFRLEMTPPQRWEVRLGFGLGFGGGR